MRTLVPFLGITLAFLSLTPRPACAYDPLLAPDASAIGFKDTTFQDAARQRKIPLRIYLPSAAKPAPVVLFSHGLGGAREGSSFLGKQWAARGYVAVFLQHPGSDEAIWKGKPLREIGLSMREAITPANFFFRVADVHATLDQLTKWNAESGHFLAGRLDLAHIAMTGHSFGAVTTQAVSGQKFVTSDALTDPRISAAIIMSPSKPAVGNTEQAFGSVHLPWLLMTGTEDIAKIGGAALGSTDMASRLAVYPALPAGDKYELVLDGAHHMAFTDRPELDSESPRNPNHHRAILALSTAFLDAYLRNDADAKAWLQGDGPRQILEPKDHWQRK